MPSFKGFLSGYIITFFVVFSLLFSIWFDDPINKGRTFTLRESSGNDRLQCQPLFDGSAFEIEKIDYSTLTSKGPIGDDPFDYQEEKDFLYRDLTIVKGNFRSIDGADEYWSQDFDDDKILKVFVGDDHPVEIPLAGYYFVMEVKMTLVSKNTFEKQDDPSIGGSINYKWDVNGHESGFLANLYYTFGYFKVVSGSGFSLDSFTQGESLNVYAEGDPFVRRGSNAIPNFDSIIDADGKIRLEVGVYAKGFVEWYAPLPRDVSISLEIHGLSVRQDLIPLFYYDNNFDYVSHEILEGNLRSLSGSSSAWSEDPDDNKYLVLGLCDNNPGLANYLYYYRMKAKLHLISHKCFTKLYKPSLGGLFNWKWNVDAQEIGNGANLYYSSATFEITSGSGFILDSYTLGSKTDTSAEGEPTLRRGTTVIPSFDSIIDSDGKIRLTITLEARGVVSWWGIETKDIFVYLELYGLSAKQNIKMHYQNDNDFDFDGYDLLYPWDNYKRALNGVGTSWSEELHDNQILELVVGDNDPFLVGLSYYSFIIGAKLHFKSHNLFEKQNDPRFSAIISFAYDINGHGVGLNAHLIYSIGGLFILKSTGEAVPLSQFVKGTSGDYNANGEPEKVSGTIVLDNFDQYIWDDKRLHFYLKCDAEGVVDWLVFEKKDIWIDLEMLGISVVQEIYPPDPTAPLITVDYIIGDRTDGNPGFWHVNAFDNESGINVSSISVYIDDIYAGSSFGLYAVPNSLGVHTIKVIVANNHPVNPLTSTKESSINIIDDDTRNPLITIEYNGTGYDSSPGFFIWSIEDFDDGIGGDFDSGLSEISITVSYRSTDQSENYLLALQPNASGVWKLNSSLGFYSIQISAQDNDDDRGSADYLKSVVNRTIKILDDDVTPPTIDLSYEEGDNTDGNPGYFAWSISDDKSGLGLIEITVSYSSAEGLDDYLLTLTPASQGIWEIPCALGSYKIEVFAKDGDCDRGEDDSLSLYKYRVEKIADDDNQPPQLSELLVEYDKKYINITFNATDESGIGQIEVFVDGTNISIVSQNVTGTTYYLTILNEWSKTNVTHELRVVVWDADFDRANDTLAASSIVTMSFYVKPISVPTGFNELLLVGVLAPLGFICVNVIYRRRKNNHH